MKMILKVLAFPAAVAVFVLTFIGWVNYHNEQVAIHRSSGQVVYNELPSGYYNTVSVSPAKVKQIGDGRIYLVTDSLPPELQREGMFFTVSFKY